MVERSHVFPRLCQIRNDAWPGMLWCNIKFQFFHRTRFFLNTEPLKHLKEFYILNSLFAIWPCGMNSYNRLSSSQRIPISLVLSDTCRHFWLERSFLHQLWWLCLGYLHHSHKPKFHPMVQCFSRSFHQHWHNHAVLEWC